MKLSRPSIALVGLLGATSLVGCDQKSQERGYVEGTVISEVWGPSNQRRASEFAFAIETSKGKVYSYNSYDDVTTDAKISIGDEVRIPNDHRGKQYEGFSLHSSKIEVIKRAK